jgi:hypothetical protein
LWIHSPVLWIQSPVWMFEISNITSGEEILKSTLFYKVCYVLHSGIRNSIFLTKIYSSPTKNLYWFVNLEVCFLMSYCICHFPAVKLKTYWRIILFGDFFKTTFNTLQLWSGRIQGI